ncbi:hypothetical protein DFP93_11686 [Aneurinibacillus soli]|uniref:Uncharacterized protein n=1 Tax=Aneurinibacillus soli TaxID=1500254 RepID=A0A0U5AZW9_9BACL|nr:hypothetical protein DFP93_11686 [Aneurinibacillus soli]BAU29281.1 hypothetical protein CB4_03468 [Aneurinibacillus soli]
MYIVIDFYQHQQVMKCPSKVGRKINKLRDEFLSWLYDRSIDHPYWVCEDGENYGLCYDADALIYWLNNYRFKKREVIANCR